MRGQSVLPAFALTFVAAAVHAQVPDTTALRMKLRSSDVETRRFALLELGRFEQPSLLPIIVPLLQSQAPEVRAQAADAIGQASQGWRSSPPARRGAISPESVAEALTARLKIESEGIVRAAIDDAIGRVPYTTAAQVASAIAALVQAPVETVSDRLGVAKGLEALIRLNRNLLPAPALFVSKLRGLAESDPGRDARVRRLSLEALNGVGRGGGDVIDDALVARAANDPDMQVRRLAMRTAALRPSDVSRGVLARGLTDEAPMVRTEALAALGSLGDDAVCSAARSTVEDRDLHVALRALDELARCGQYAADVALLEHAMNDLSTVGIPRGWHKAAHALVALAAAQPDRCRTALPQFVTSRNWALRMYAAKAATVLGDRASLGLLVGDENGAVSDEAHAGLVALGALAETRPAPEADAEAAADPVLSAAALRELSQLRARVTVRDVGSFEMALLPIEAPLTVQRVVALAEAGRYNGLIIRRVLPNVAAEVGVQPDDPSSLAVLTRDETGPWPHVRGAVGLNDESGFFINLTDNPQFDHQFTVFAQLLNGMDVVDALLEGDIIERVDILKP